MVCVGEHNFQLEFLLIFHSTLSAINICFYSLDRTKTASNMLHVEKATIIGHYYCSDNSQYVKKKPINYFDFNVRLVNKMYVRYLNRKKIRKHPCTHKLIVNK